MKSESFASVRFIQALALATAATLTFCLNSIQAQTPTNTVWRYQLLPGSELTDECLICGRPPIVVPMRGEFRLRLLQENPLFSYYALENIELTSGSAPGPHYKVFGNGLYHVGGEVALIQDMSLAVYVDDGTTNRLCFFTNQTRRVTRPWPFIEITLPQTNGIELQTFTLKFEAAPLREIWFSTTHSFTPGVQPPYTNRVSPGDLVSSTGHVIKRNQALTACLGLMTSPDPLDLGLDAVDILPGGEIAFSIEQDAFSETLGPLHGGDVLSDQGRIVTNYTALIGAFGPEPPPADEGLDALQVMPNGEIYFSVTNDFFSETLGRLIRKGDLLSSRGVILKTNEELIARFHPAFPKQDYGLDALYVWPDGEVWFSVATRFYGQHFDSYAPGDLLSDRGYVVARNLDLLAAFSPLEDLADFGLDAVFVVTDPVPPPAVREVWFSATREFHASIWQPPTNRVSPGDFLSSAGRIVKRNEELTARLDLSRTATDLGLDAVDVLPGGEIVFSLEQDVFSERLGPLQRGDLLSNRGRIVARNQDLTRAFVILPPVPDVGLDAVQVLDSGEILFSLETDIFTGTGGLLHHGDLLSNRGVVIRTHDALLARFHPPPIPHDFGLDAIYVWPSGEMWFSLAEGFTDAVLGPILPGDLLSDQGQIICGNLRLLDRFAPVEDLADFGLDALFVVNDATEPVPGVPEPICRVTSLNPVTGDVILGWQGAGRAFQIEKATNILGPWAPLSPILTEPPVIDCGALTNSPRGFYRLRQW